MTSDDRTSHTIRGLLALFISFIAAESLCRRLSGWLGCRAIVTIGLDVRPDMFRRLSGHPIDYFAEHMARVPPQPGHGDGWRHRLGSRHGDQ